MKKTISKIISGLVLTTSMALILISCQKEQNAGSVNDLRKTKSVFSSNEQAAALMPTGCEAAIPAILNVPEGNRLAFRTYATGVQIYQVRRSTTNPNEFVWVNTAPAANLYMQPNYNNLVGTHYGGPTWDFIQGLYKNEKAVAVKLEGVTVDPSAIPWLKLKTVEALSSPGNKITYIQRVCTTGGLPPAIIPNESNQGQVEEVPYTATYLFFEKK